MNNLKLIAREISENLLKLDAHFSHWLGKPALRPEARLLLLLGIRGPISVKEAMHESPLSHRSFYMILDKMKEAGIVELKGGDSDARVRRIHISSYHEHEFLRILELFDDNPAIMSHFEKRLNSLTGCEKRLPFSSGLNSP